jgi:cytochrome c biogenesis protein CcdA
LTTANTYFGQIYKVSQLQYAIGDCLPRSLGFYFGSAIFFIGLLTAAAGTSRVIAETLDFMTFMDFIVGVVLVLLGLRAIRSVQHGSSAESSAK